MYQKRTDLRCQLAEQFIANAVRAGHRVVVVDNSDDACIRDAFYNLDALVIHQVAGTSMGAARREAMRIASETESQFQRLRGHESSIVMWCEPEKYPLVPSIGSLADFMRAEEADLVIPTRRNLDNYPPYQAVCEQKGNEQVGAFTGRPDLDLWVGPRLMGRKAIVPFLRYNGERGDMWQSIFIPVAQCLADNMKVLSMTVDYPHPPEQTAAEVNDEKMDRKRDLQLSSIVECMRDVCAELKLLHAAA